MRQSGILLPVTSLPSPYGIGTMGKAAYNWIDFLENAKQSYWQVLPLGPTSFKDSPYQTFSAFAGNPYLIDLDMLVEDGLLEENDLSEYMTSELRTRTVVSVLISPDTRMFAIFSSIKQAETPRPPRSQWRAADSPPSLSSRKPD